MPEPLLPTINGPRDLKKLRVDQLDTLAGEIRHAICEQVSKTGGHLAPNLGVVELTIALHYVFDFSHDRLLFDVGHQCYPHKLLTGRLGIFDKLRSQGGMSGFPEPKESEFDLFSVGHAGTAISTAVGMARGDDMMAPDPGSNPGSAVGQPGASDRKAVVLIGDASIVNGVALEGLNNAGTLQRQFLTVLNDNGMSISQPQGAMAGYFDRVRVSTTYHDIKKRGKTILDRLPGGSILEEVYHRGSDMLKAMVSHGHMFEHFGHICIGPVDGHDLPTLIPTLAEVRDIGRPVLLHVKTIKGKGYEFSEDDATTFHSPKPFKREGCRVEMDGGGRSFTAAYADAMLDVMDRDEKVFAVTAAMGPGTGVDKLIEAHPRRTLDTGICESHAMDMCAGLAKSGVKPFFAVYSTFAQRALDQVFQEVALQGLPVRVCMDRAGFVGGDGAVHHGFMDIAMFRTFPDVALLAASDEPTLKASLEFMRTHDAGASFLRYPRDNVAASPVLSEQDCPAFELGKAVCVHPAKGQAAGGQPTLAILAYGTPVYDALSALPMLREHGHDVAIYDARFAKPVDLALITELLNAGVPILTVEDHLVDGGFGAAVLESANAAGLDTRLIHRHGMPARWVGPNSRSNQLADAGLDPAGIAARGLEAIRAAATSLKQTPTPQPADEH